MGFGCIFIASCYPSAYGGGSVFLCPPPPPLVINQSPIYGLLTNACSDIMTSHQFFLFSSMHTVISVQSRSYCSPGEWEVRLVKIRSE